MAAPFLATLPRSARQALPFIRAGVNRGLSSRAIERTIRDAGIPISRSRTILPTMRVLRDMERQGANVRFIRPDARINTLRLPPAITETRRRYSYRYRVEGVTQFGEPYTRYLHIATDRDDLTRGQLDELAQTSPTITEGSAIIEGETFHLEHGMQRAQFGEFAVSQAGVRRL